jgi:DnaJ-class molecular chaperone
LQEFRYGKGEKMARGTRRCPACGGTKTKNKRSGIRGYKTVKCSRCNGTGRVKAQTTAGKVAEKVGEGFVKAWVNIIMHGK